MFKNGSYKPLEGPHDICSTYVENVEQEHSCFVLKIWGFTRGFVGYYEFACELQKKSSYCNVFSLSKSFQNVSRTLINHCQRHFYVTTNLKMKNSTQFYLVCVFSQELRPTGLRHWTGIIIYETACAQIFIKTEYKVLYIMFLHKSKQ